MSLITILWSMIASACLTLAAVHLVIWTRQRSGLASLLFAAAAIAVAGISAGELLMMNAQSVDAFAAAMRWTHLPIFVLIVSLVGFVRVYFGTGRLWLGGLICGLRAAILIVNFLKPPNVNFREITALREVEVFGGELVSVGQGVLSSWSHVAQGSSLLFVVYVLDASMLLWRRGTPIERRRAILVGGSMSLFVVIAVGQAILVIHGLLPLPFLISIPFLAPLLVMGHELGLDAVRAAQLVGQLRDSEQRLHDSEEQLSLAVNAADLGLWLWNPAADHVWMNDKNRALFGIDESPPHSLSHWISHIDPRDRSAVSQSMTHALEHGCGYEQEYRVLLPDGKVRWLAARGKANFDPQTGAALMRGVSLDITTRKHAEERFQHVVEAAPNGMVMINPKGAITLVNTQAEAIFGYSRDELIGKHIETLVPGQRRKEHSSHRDGFFVTPARRDMGGDRELFGLRKDGTEVPVEVGLNPIQTSEGLFVLASIVDTTERRRMERDAARQRNELAHLSRITMLGELSGSLAHELNQPLTAILSNAQAGLRFLAQDASDIEEVREILNDIIDADKRAGETIHRLRVLFRKGEVESQLLDANAVVEEVLSFLNSEFINNSVTVQTNLSPQVPAIRGDRVQIQQVLINILVNSCDAMHGVDDRRLTIRTERQASNGVVITVSDCGCGIPPETIEHIFEPFVTTKSKGMGLGLAVCRTIVTAHGGTLWATNNPDRGATFHIAFPAVSSA